MVRIPGPQDVNLPQSRRINFQRDRDFDPLGGNIARGLAQVAEKLQARRQQADDNGFLSNVAANSEVAYTQLYDDHKNTVPGGEEFITSLDDRLSKSAEQIIEQAKKGGGYRPSREAEQRAKLQLSGMRGNFLVRAATYQNNVRVEKATNDTVGYMDQLSSTTYYDPTLLSENLAKIQQAGEGLKSIVPEDVALGTLEDAKRKATLSAVNGLIDTDPEAALEFLEDNQENPNLPPEDHISLTRTANVRLSQAVTKMEAKAKQAAKEFVSDTILSFENGFPVSSREYERAQQAAALVGETEDLGVARAASEYILLPKSARDGLPETAQGVEEAELRLALEKADETITRELNRDGYAFAERQGVVDQVPLDVTDPSTIQERLRQVGIARNHYGKEISPLKEEEAESLVNALPNLSPGEKTQLALAFGPSQAIWEQLDKKHAGTFAMLGAIGQPDIMMAAFDGQKKIEDGTFDLPTKTDYLPVFDDYVGDVYPTSDRKALLNAALSYYAGTTEETDFDADDFEQALEQVTGGIVNINGHKTQLPRGVSDDDFEDFIDNFTPGTVRALGGVWAFSDEEAAEAIQNSRIRSIGQDRYVVIHNDAILLSENGNPLEITYDPELMQVHVQQAIEERARVREETAQKAKDREAQRREQRQQFRRRGLAGELSE